MKIMNKSILLLFLPFAMGVAAGFSACTSGEGETDIVSKTLDQYKQEISQFVASEKAIVETCVVGYNKGDFKIAATYDEYKAAYLAVLVAAEAVLGKQDVTIAEIVAANETLASPGKAFTSSLWISDRRPLNDAIVAAETLNAATPEGTEKGQAPADAKAAFTAAITSAKAVRGASTTIDRQVTDAVAKLEDARQTFLKAVVK